MEVGIGIPNAIKGADGPLFARWARKAEERGFSSLGTIGRVAYPTYEELTTLAVCGAVTDRIGLLTDILVGPTRDPVMLAKQAATVDRLSGGRLTLGFGVGGRPDDFEASGRPFSGRGRRFDQDIETMLEAWKGKPVAGANDAVCPSPVRGRIPMLFGGHGEHVARRVARFGDGYTGTGGPPMIADTVEAVKTLWAEAGRNGEPRISSLVYFAIGDESGTPEANINDYYAFLGDIAGMIASSIIKTPEAAADALTAHADVGVGEVVFVPTTTDVAQVDRLADAVL